VKQYAIRILVIMITFSLALPHQSFGNTLNTDERLEELNSEDLLISPENIQKELLNIVEKLENSLPDEIPVTVKEAADISETSLYSLEQIQLFKPLGQTVISKRKKQTLELVCLEDIEDVKKCKKVQFRKNGTELIGAVYLIRKEKKDVFLGYLKQMVKNVNVAPVQATKSSELLTFEQIPVLREYTSQVFFKGSYVRHYNFTGTRGGYFEKDRLDLDVVAVAPFAGGFIGFVTGMLALGTPITSSVLWFTLGGALLAFTPVILAFAIIAIVNAIPFSSQIRKALGGQLKALRHQIQYLRMRKPMTAMTSLDSKVDCRLSERRFKKLQTILETL